MVEKDDDDHGSDPDNCKRFRIDVIPLCGTRASLETLLYAETINISELFSNNKTVIVFQRRRNRRKMVSDGVADVEVSDVILLRALFFLFRFSTPC